MNQISGMFCTIKNYFLALSSDSTECSFTRVKKAAFTLAEVLITLGIIGVVAAMTMPVLISNHQKRVYVTQLKKAASTLENALRMMAVSEGVAELRYTECGSSPTKQFLNPEPCLQNIEKQMKVLKQTSGCREDWCDISNHKQGALAPHMRTTVLTDGTAFVYTCSIADIWVDINGIKKGPNESGKDFFYFYIDYDNNRVIPGGAQNLPDSAMGVTDVTCTSQTTDYNMLANCTAQVLATGKMDY